MLVNYGKRLDFNSKRVNGLALIAPLTSTSILVRISLCPSRIDLYFDTERNTTVSDETLRKIYGRSEEIIVVHKPGPPGFNRGPTRGFYF